MSAPLVADDAPRVASQPLQALLGRCVATGLLNKSEILSLLELIDPDEIAALFKAADIVRKAEVGDEVHLRGLIEFSNYCRKNCPYCGLRRDNRSLERYRLKPQEIIDLAMELDERGFRTTVLQSGEDLSFSADVLAKIVSEIKSKTDLAVTLSVGERSRDDYALWRQAGADRYLLRHETVNSRLYDDLQTGSSLSKRLTCIQNLQSLGYQVGIGFMAGLPGQSLDDIAADLEFAQSFQPDMLGIGPFIPSPETPMGDQPGGTLELALKCVALARIVTRNSLIPATTAMGSIDEFGREKALQAGANVLMPNWTPLGSREKYTIYPNKRCINEDPKLCQGCLEMRVMGIGRTISRSRGDSPKKCELHTI
ncbi:MAG: [FeFe] hydrogenase H-cluster radical SAM maturase HydE [Armatimonadota bacterium]